MANINMAHMHYLLVFRLDLSPVSIDRVWKRFLESKVKSKNMCSWDTKVLEILAHFRILDASNYIGYHFRKEFSKKRKRWMIQIVVRGLKCNKSWKTFDHGEKGPTIFIHSMKFPPNWLVFKLIFNMLYICTMFKIS